VSPPEFTSVAPWRVEVAPLPVPVAPTTKLP